MSSNPPQNTAREQAGTKKGLGAAVFSQKFPFSDAIDSGSPHGPSLQAPAAAGNALLAFRKPTAKQAAWRRIHGDFYQGVAPAAGKGWLFLESCRHSRSSGKGSLSLGACTRDNPGLRSMLERAQDCGN